ncbi:MAG TPA: PHP-associated domain-containing protein [Bryobacteraceae bacterium]|nr:PHP-associated domain-containing protein [Bryobacteraceae bacterium]
MRCDLHVHTVHSGMCTVPVLSRVCRESYNEPRALYDTLKRRGMDLVTVTDHDSIDAMEELRRHPDFFLSEEVTCTMPSGTEMHAGVYGIAERDHIELQRRRTDIESLLAYAVERRLFVTVNHIYSSLTGSRTEDDFAIFARDFHGVETRNGQILPCANRLAAEFAARFGKPMIGGSDSHTLACAGRTWTEVPGARSAEEFLTGMRRGHSTPHGESGDYWKLTGAVWNIGASLVRSQPWTASLAVLFAAAPAVTFANYLRELVFAWYWGQKNRPIEPAGAASEAAL